jgi:hypothetical protein
VPDSSSPGIFLSYRREDAAPYARLLQFQLRERFPGVQVFLDLDSIEAGLDFAEVIQEALDSCSVLVALIGRQWATLVDDRGIRRLENPDDLVRYEIQTALERAVRVIPVLVDGARAPQQQELPIELHKLARLNAFELSYRRFDYDASQLVELIRKVLAAASSTRFAVGQLIIGMVVKIITVGAFVSLPPDKIGFLHINQIRRAHAGKRIGSITDVMQIGENILVEVRGINDRGKISLAMHREAVDRDV